MTTTRLYYPDSSATTFDAVIVSCDEREGRFDVTLDRTAFYPTSGGQPFDTGTLGDARVIDVLDRDDGVVVHVVDRSVAVGAAVSGAIDWDRRFDRMQQHTGQHVLSAAFDRAFGVRTESFHLGATSATIDLARELSPAEIRAAEADANRVVWEDRPVAIRFATPEEAAALPLRKEPARSGPLRLIDVQDFDLSACGGTHVSRTGAIGVIAVSGWEKVRGGTRVEFLCGSRALDRFREWRESLATTIRLLSVTPPELPAAVERLQGESKSLQRTIRSLQEQLAVHEARALVARGQRLGDRVIAAEALDGWDAAGLKAMASAAALSEPAAGVALFSRSTPALVVVARGSASTVDASGVLKSLVAAFGGKGGGKSELAQGGGLNGNPDDLIREAVRPLGG